MMRARERGFSLIEVMIAVLVTTIGLLGLASLQVVSLRTQHNAYLRGTATQANHDMIERLRADCVAALAGSYDIAYAAVPGAGADLPNTELRAWRALVGRLPGGQGAVSVTPAGVATVAVRWDDARGDGGAENTPVGTPLEFAETTRICQ